MFSWPEIAEGTRVYRSLKRTQRAGWSGFPTKRILGRLSSKDRTKLRLSHGMDWALPSEDQPSPGGKGGPLGRTLSAPGLPALHRPRMPAGGVVSAPAAAAAARPSQRGGERRGPEGAAGAAGSGRSGRRGPTWKRRGAAVDLPAAAAATRASAVAGAESGHGGGTSPSGPRRPAPQERWAGAQGTWSGPDSEEGEGKRRREPGSVWNPDLEPSP